MSQIVTNDAAVMRRMVEAALANFNGAAQTASDARQLATGELNKAMSVRESVLRSLAAAAHEGKWESETLGGIIKDLVKSRYNNAATITTFAGELKRACSARVRSNVERIFDVAHAAWDAEDAANEGKTGKDRVTPLHREFQRVYHMAVAAMKDDAPVVEAPADFVRWAMARARARQLDYAKVFKRKTAIVEELQRFAQDFPVDAIIDAIDDLNAVTAAELEAAAKRKIAQEAAPVENDGDAPEPVGEIEPAEGVVTLEDAEDAMKLAAD